MSKMRRGVASVGWLLVCGGIAACGGSDGGAGTVGDVAVVAPDEGGGDSVTAPDTVEPVDSSGPEDSGSADTVSGEDAGAGCAADQCEIDGACWDNAAPNPDNDCEICQVVADRDAWTPDDTAVCDDGDACTAEEHCADGECVGVPAVACDDGSLCTDDNCNPESGDCVFVFNEAPCEDGDVCTGGETCFEGSCQGGTAALACDDGNACTEDSCDPSEGCTNTVVADGSVCSDGDECTEEDACLAGACVGTERDCTDDNFCTLDLCVTGLNCVHKSLEALCADDNPCTDEACDADQGCVYPFNAIPCDDGNACTANDSCQGGACLGLLLIWDDENPCTDDACDPLSGISHIDNSNPCEDGDQCTLADFCVGGQCWAGPEVPICEDGNLCTEDSCESASGCVFDNNSEPCEDGNVCTQVDNCTDGDCVGSEPLGCDDQNSCTLDGCHPEDGCIYNLVQSNACRPSFELSYPPRGATILGEGGDPTVTVLGSVSSGAGDIVLLTLNGEPVDLAADGSFSVPIAAQVGGNILVLEAEDALGTVKKHVQSFLWSTTYFKPNQDIPKSGMVDPGIGVYLSQEVIDDGDHSLPPDDLATVFEQLLSGLNIGGAFSNPVAENSQYKINLKNLTHGSPQVQLSAVDGGLGLNVTVANVKVDVDADGKSTGVCLPFGGGCLNYPDISGDIKISNVTITGKVALSVQDHNIQAALESVDVSMSDPNVNIDGVLSFILEPIAQSLVDDLKSDLENDFEGSIADELEPQVEGALASLAFGFDFEMPSLDPNGSTVPVQVVTDASYVDFQGAPNPGGLVALRTGVYAPSVSPHATSQHLGSAGRVGCNAGPQNLVVAKEGALELVLSDDMINELLYAAWLGGFLEFDVPSDMLADVDLTTFGVDNLELTVSGMLAPTISDCGPNEELLVHIGDLRVDASLDLFGSAVDVVIFVSLSAGFELTAGDGEVGIGITDVKVLESQVSVEQDELVASEGVIQALIGDNLVPSLLDSLGGGALAGIPLPAFEVAEGAAITIVPEFLTRASGNSIVSGDLQ